MTDFDSVIEDYKQGNLKLKNIPPSLWGNDDFVIEICNLNQSATSFFCDQYPDLFNNKKIVLSIFQKNRASFSYLNNELREDVDFWIELLKIDSGLNLLFASEIVQKDIRIGLLSKSSSNFQYVNSALKNDINYISYFVQDQPLIVSKLSPEILNDKEFMYKIFTVNSNAVNVFVKSKSELLLDKEFLKDIIQISPEAILYLPQIYYNKDLLINFRDIIEKEDNLILNNMLNQYLREDELLKKVDEESFKKNSKIKSKI